MHRFCREFSEIQTLVLPTDETGLQLYETEIQSEHFIFHREGGNEGG